MKIAVIGAGPAGLFFARLRKLRAPADEIVVFEQNARGSTFGFGVSIAGRAMDRYDAVDPELTEQIAKASRTMPDQRIAVDDQSYCLKSGVTGAGIERQALLNLMSEACLKIGVDIRYGERVGHASSLQGYDLVVGADGSNSTLLSEEPNRFRRHEGMLGNRFAWFGLGISLEEAGLSFKRVGPWRFVGHYYPYNAGLSTFVAEVDAATWKEGFGHLNDAERRAAFESAFEQELQGSKLLENRSIWRQFRYVDNGTWHFDNRVLLGDALSVAHFSIGSGTRLAMDDALALSEAFDAAHGAVNEALVSFEKTRRPIRNKLMEAARCSWTWYESLRLHMELPILPFVHSFMTRTGRFDNVRLAQAVPEFVSDYNAWLDGHAGPD